MKQQRNYGRAILIILCMTALGYLVGFEYRELTTKDAGILRWTAAVLAVIGWCCILWKVAFYSRKKRR